MPQVLLITCQDAVGLIHKITGVLFSQNLNIVSNDEFVDSPSSRFFMRTEFTGEVEAKHLLGDLKSILPPDSDVRLASDAPKSIVVLAGREPHCLGELLMRQCNGELKARIAAVLSNHSDLQALVERFQVPFHHVPALSEDRLEHERLLRSTLQAYAPDYLVLAKYMRILSGNFISAFPKRIINIHHSFLPAFIGAQPYRQAYNRGVKIIGATAHFVTEALDDGPIIVQNVLSVTHAHSAKSMAREGREIEKIVLARALTLVLEDRVFVSGNKTIIFE